jgi:transcription initiation factor TFIIB
MTTVASQSEYDNEHDDDQLWDMFHSLEKQLKTSDTEDDQSIVKDIIQPKQRKKQDYGDQSFHGEVATSTPSAIFFEADIGSLDAVCNSENCSSTTFVLEDGNYICRKCGSLQERLIDAHAEWRYYGHEDNKSADPTRCGMPTNEFLPGMSLGSVIGYDSRTRMTGYMFKISKYQKWNSMSYKERNLYNIIDSMSIKALNGGISQSIIDEAKVLYKRISDMKISRGENREGLIASSIYMSCKRNKVPRSAKEIAAIFGLPLTTMTRGCKKFQEIMKVNISSCTSPDDFIPRFVSRLGMRPEHVELCHYVVNKEQEYSIVSENSPPSIASGCIYLVSVVCGLPFSKKDVSLACEISEITINKCFRKLYEYRMYLFPLEVTEAVEKKN